jgi:hypothetical protein
MKLTLHDDVYYAAVGDGVYLVSPEGSRRITGASIAQWVDRLAPYLDGRNTLAELTAGLPRERKQMVERVVAALRDCGAIREVADDQPAALSASALAGYAPEIEYLRYFITSATEVFSRYRSTATLVIGDGQLLVDLVRAGLRTGLGRVRVAVADARTRDLLRVAGVDASGGAEPPRSLPVSLLPPALDDEDRLGVLLDGVGLVLHVADEETPARAQLLDRCCARAGVPLAQAIVTDREVWLVPIGQAGATEPAGIWSAAWPRLSATQPAAIAHAGAGHHQPSQAATAAVASQLAHAAFRALTGVADPAEATRLTRVDLDTLRSDHLAFVPHPLARPAAPATEAEFHDRVETLERGGRLGEAEFSRRAARCAGERMGVVAFVDSNWAQIPLHVSQVVVPDPVGLRPRHQPPVTAVGAGFGYQTARCQAVLGGLARYGALMVDPRRLLDRTAEPKVDAGCGPDAAVRALRASSPAAAIWGYELDAARKARLVPAARVFASLRAGVPPTESDPGVAAGYDWQEAVTNGLIGHCRALAINELRHFASPYPRFDLTGVTLDPTGARCRDLLADLGELPETYDITGSLGVPTLALRVGTGSVVCASGLTTTQALTDGLLQVLLARQADSHSEADYRPPAISDIPAGAWGDDLRRARLNPDPLDVATVARRFRDLGQVAVAVPLDHDPAVAEIMPYLVKVVMCDD